MGGVRIPSKDGGVVEIAQRADGSVVISLAEYTYRVVSAAEFGEALTQMRRDHTRLYGKKKGASKTND